MKTKQILVAGLLLMGAMNANAQSQTPSTTSAIEDITETGYGLENGAVQNLLSSTSGAVFFGYQAGMATTTKNVHGNNNSFLGSQSGKVNTTGASNVFVGALTGFKNISGSQNIFVGANAGDANTSGSRNIFIGQDAGGANTTASFNTFTGWNSGLMNTGSNNTFYGYSSGRANTLSANNAFFGANSGILNNSDDNAFFGANAGAKNTTGTSNNFFGSSAGVDNSTGSYNIFVGTFAGFRNQTGNSNVYVGHGAGFSVVGGGGNTMLGHGSGGNAIGGSNTFIGHAAGGNATGSSNVFIGYNSGVDATGDNKLYISNSNTPTPMIYGDFTTSKVGIGGFARSSTADGFPTTAGNVNVSSYKLFVKGGILTEEVRVSVARDWADYVFSDKYKLATLPEVEKYIAANGHLPNVPSAKEVKEDGIELGQMANIHQEKIEELTLYVIQQNKQLEAQQKEIDELKASVKALMNKQ
jgi:hypothetical protein